MGLVEPRNSTESSSMLHNLEVSSVGKRTSCVLLTSFGERIALCGDSLSVVEKPSEDVIMDAKADGSRRIGLCGRLLDKGELV